MRAPLCIALALLVASPVAQANLLTNGDFSSGNIGFSSQYFNSSNITLDQTYQIGTNPSLGHVLAASYGDHTTGTGLMLNANGSMTPNRYIWQQSVLLDQATNYVMSGWIASWGNTGASRRDPSPARLKLFVDGFQVGDDFVATAANGVWSEFHMIWNSGSNTTSLLQLFDANTAGAGNDFSLDDLSLKVPEPSTGLLLGVGLLAGIRRRRSS